MTAKISWSVNGGPIHTETRDLGQLPIMVKVRLAPISARGRIADRIAFDSQRDVI